MKQNEHQENCGNCRYYGVKDCRRRSPQQDKSGYAVWPHVEIGDWCGEHELDRMKKSNREITAKMKEDNHQRRGLFTRLPDKKQEPRESETVSAGLE